MALTPQQEAFLAALADKGIAEQDYDAKVAAMSTAREAALAALPKRLLDDTRRLTGDAQKQAILDLQAAIAADPEVARLEAEAAQLKAKL